MSANTLQITPFMHVRDCQAAIRFLVETLGFTAIVDEGQYAYLEREGAGLRVLGHQNALEVAGKCHGGFAYYIDVRDVGLVVEQLGSRLATLAQHDVQGPVDQPYGQRELMIRMPDGNLLVFGQPIEARSS